MMPDEIRVRDGDIELRRTTSFGPGSRPYLEIVRWQGVTCYTVASWTQDADGYDLGFTGRRPFELDETEQEKFWRLARVGQEMLEA